MSINWLTRTKKELKGHLIKDRISVEHIVMFPNAK